MDSLSKFPIRITTATMVYKLPKKIDKDKIIYNDDIISNNNKLGFFNALCVKIIYDNKIYSAKIGDTEISICGIKDINNAQK